MLYYISIFYIVNFCCYLNEHFRNLIFEKLLIFNIRNNKIIFNQKKKKKKNANKQSPIELNYS